MKVVLIAAGAILLLLLLIAAVKAAFSGKRGSTEPAAQPENVDADRAIQNLSDAIKIKTISNADSTQTDWAEFERFHAFLRERYPLVHESLVCEKVSTASLMYHWQGTDSSLDPIALLAHIDVVPVSSGTEGDWQHPPFSGTVADDHIWGRGAMDMKHHLVAVMESVEALLKDGYVPKRSVYICLGHNEEIVAAPDSGAAAMAQLLKSRGVQLESVLDEGGIMMPVTLPIINATFAAIGTTEKGYADFSLTVKAKGGHSSSPPKHTALGTLAKAITKLERKPFKAKMLPVTRELIESAGTKMPFYLRFFLCNVWLFKPLLLTVMKQLPPTASVIRTTLAVTQAQGSPAANVLPQAASATVNCRILPGESVESTKARIKKIINNNDIAIEVLKCKEPSPISPTTSRAYKTIESLCAYSASNSAAIPLLVMGGTDSHNYEQICKNVYRFSPFVVDSSLLYNTHATNERLPVSAMNDAVAFFKRYVKAMASE